ncbi:MAG TPA: hypothetical protein VHX38_04135 [Pseudonocardiaceae bacterium]|jgi:hypothetical protein|nr:hypothetical protein [Pseudonocardiaceae bacterium]
MDRRIAETTLDTLSDERYARLHRHALATTEQLVAELAATEVLRGADTGVKPGDVDDEPDRRIETLRRVKAGRLVGIMLAEVAAEFTAGEAATAVWLGASLADLGSASGSTRQAARKRWPDLGQIYRTRRWLSGYRNDIFHITDLLLAAFTPNADQALAEALNDLRDASEVLRADFASGSSVDAGPSAPDGSGVRWQRLGELIDRQVRRVGELATAETDEATFALDASKGLLAYYDSVTSQPSR